MFVRWDHVVQYANEIFECLLIFVLSKEHEQVCSDGEGGGESRLGQDGDGAPVFHHQGCEHLIKFIRAN